MRKKILALILASVVTVTGIVGCGGTEEKGDSSGKIEITFWHSMGGIGGETINKLVHDFNDSQEKIKVSAEYQGDYDDAINKLKSSALSNSGPDLMQLYDIGTKWMIDSGYAYEMQELVDKNNYDISKLEDNILDYYRVDGKLYSMPFNTSTPILYYNKTAFEEVGLDKNVAPKNFDEIIEFSNKLVKKNGNTVERYGYAMQIYGWFFEQFLLKQELNYANNNNGRSGNADKVEFDTNGGAKKIFEGWKKLIDSGVVGNFGRKSDDTTEVFVAGKTAMMIGSTASLGDIKGKINNKFELGTAYMPSVSADNKGGVSIGGGSLWAMDKGDLEKADATFEFIKYMVSSEVQVKWAKATGYFSVTKEAYDLPEMTKHLEEYPEFKTAINQLREKNNSSGALMGVFPEARATIEENLEKVLSNELSVDDAVKKATETINTALEKYGKSSK
ncbi:MAG: ABC transporter substrate-binding protein [Clostridium sp.]